jgi:site-specific recombinase XerD
LARRCVSNALLALGRLVPISNKLKSFLDSFKPSVLEMKWFFPSPNGKRWDPDNLSRYLRKGNEEAGLDWNCLVYRHTFGSQLAMKGESLYKISALMGNSPEICRRHYAALIPEAMIESVEF